ncbi:VOC family protein [uncultured Maribacter sp.]|uniref:VOC family protein n=1 Tax=uncultured Maribacter sp. TaxID=431308 RepID=UPI00261CF206|nr:VOC family protein [uncultured Maribacter sp.]
MNVLRKLLSITIIITSLNSIHAQDPVTNKHASKSEISATVSGMTFVTKDLESSILFYTKFLGFTVRKRIKIDTPEGLANFGVKGDQELDYVGLVPAEFSEDNIIMGINFIEITEALDGPLLQKENRNPIAGEQMIAFSVQSLLEIEKQMQAANIPLIAPITPSATGKSMTLTVLDPNGIRIHMYEYIKN